MLEEIQKLIVTKDICVLATAAENVPHCSLMAYVAAPDARTIYLATSRSTRKYANITRNPKVSLLMDSRENPDRATAQALTVGGTAAPMADGTGKDDIRAALLKRHPHLDKLLEHPDADILEVQVDTVLLLSGVREAHFERIS